MVGPRPFGVGVYVTSGVTMNRNYIGSCQVTASAESSCVTPKGGRFLTQRHTKHTTRVISTRPFYEHTLYSVTQCYRLVDCYNSVMTECMVLCHSLTLSILVSHKHNRFYSQSLRRPCCLYSMVINIYIRCCCASCTLAVEHYILDWIPNASSQECHTPAVCNQRLWNHECQRS